MNSQEGQHQTKKIWAAFLICAKKNHLEGFEPFFLAKEKINKHKTEVASSTSVPVSRHIYLPLNEELQADAPGPTLRCCWALLGGSQGEGAGGREWVEALWEPVVLLMLQRPSTHPRRWSPLSSSPLLMWQKESNSEVTMQVTDDGSICTKGGWGLDYTSSEWN